MKLAHLCPIARSIVSVIQPSSDVLAPVRTATEKYSLPVQSRLREYRRVAADCLKRLQLSDRPTGSREFLH